MKHRVNPQIFVNITLVMVAAVLSACANNTQYDAGYAHDVRSYEERPCPCKGPCPNQMYVEKVEINKVVVPAPTKAIGQSAPGGDRVVAAQTKKVKPCPQKQAPKPAMKDVEPEDVKKKPTPPVEVVASAPKAKPVVEQKPGVTEEVVTTTTVTESVEVKTQPDSDVLVAEAEKERLQKELEALKAEQARLASEKETVLKQIEENKKCDEIKDWVATEGSTLRGLLTEWGDQAGWRVVWNMDRDYTLEAGAVFRGRFVDVSSALLRSFARARPAPKGVFYKGNKVLVISTREDENAE